MFRPSLAGVVAEVVVRGRYAGAAAGLALWAGLAGVADAKCGRLVRFEPEARLSAHEISRLALPRDRSPRALDLPGGVGLTFWPFDVEAQPRRDGWSAYAVIFADDGVGGAEPVGGVLWAATDSDLYSAPRASFARDGGDMVLRIAQATISMVCPGGLAVRLAAGGRLFVDGAPAGRLSLRRAVR